MKDRLHWDTSFAVASSGTIQPNNVLGNKRSFDGNLLFLDNLTLMTTCTQPFDLKTFSTASVDLNLLVPTASVKQLFSKNSELIFAWTIANNGQLTWSFEAHSFKAQWSCPEHHLTFPLPNSLMISYYILGTPDSRLRASHTWSWIIEAKWGFNSKFKQRSDENVWLTLSIFEPTLFDLVLSNFLSLLISSNLLNYLGGL